MKLSLIDKANAQQPHTLPSRTSQSSNQNLAKSVSVQRTDKEKTTKAQSSR